MNAQRATAEKFQLGFIKQQEKKAKPAEKEKAATAKKRAADKACKQTLREEKTKAKAVKQPAEVAAPAKEIVFEPEAAPQPAVEIK